MSYPMHMRQQQKQSQSLKQQQRLIMSPQMQQAIGLLQAPTLEMATLIINELEQNPVLEYEEDAENRDAVDTETVQDQEDQEDLSEKELSFDERDFEILRQIDEDFEQHFSQSEGYYSTRNSEEEKLREFLESSIRNESSLFETLMSQAGETFESEEEMAMAEAVIGNLDEKGYLTIPLAEIAALENVTEEQLSEILEEVQTFKPYGVGAANLQESLLIQLRAQFKKETLAYMILEHHFEDLIHNRIPLIQKSLSCTPSDIEMAIEKHISHLDLHPGTQCSKNIVQHIVPDLTIDQEEDKLITFINNEYIPQVRANRRYLRMLYDETLSPETKEFIKQKVMSAKWLLRNIYQRNETLKGIASFLADKQRKFFLHHEGNLVPLTMKEVAEELEVHESTVARAVSNKYIDTPRGLFPLRFFFTASYTSEEGDEVSADTVRKLLKKMIDHEDKIKPFSDEMLSKKLKEEGIPCARRTVAKYRAELNVGNAQQRKKY